MDHIPSLLKSHKGNTKLLIWVNLFTGDAMTKASSSWTAQAIAEGRMVGQRQQAITAYRPHANSTAEKIVQTLIRPSRCISLIADCVTGMSMQNASSF
ncbi:unnamed protein product [Peronospora belbahrii]|uniref:Uncharacterized protein n=1 Tax=Peronospora belbahrii TaxID=622444 RepID=A0ABN8CV25_9STRA|nr:unnamed protein product [Peronospora belbahrii]